MKDEDWTTLFWGFIICMFGLTVLAEGCKSATRNPNRDWKGDYQPANKYELSKEMYDALIEAGKEY